MWGYGTLRVFQAPQTLSMAQVVSKRVSLMLGTCILMSCARVALEHPTYGVQHLEDDRTECLHQATAEQMQADPHTGAVFDKQEAVQQCLIAKGYIQRWQD